MTIGSSIKLLNRPARLCGRRWTLWSTALRKAGTEVDYQKYKDLGHGFGPGTGTRAEG
jgi:hypothetical protein